MIKPIRIPSLPFASSIAGGEQHAGVRTTNDVLFDIKYLAKLYKIHQNDIPQLLSSKLSEELDSYAKTMNQDLVMVMFDRLLTLEAKGIISVSVSKENRLFTIAYHFNVMTDTMDVVMSIADFNNKEPFDVVLFAFTAEIIDETNTLDIDIPADVSIPIMFKEGHSLADLSNNAWHLIKLICAFEAMFAYHCIKFKNFMYDAMLEKDGVMLNPNFVQVSLLTLEDEEKPSI